MANEIKMMAASGGSKLYSGAATYAKADNSLNANTRSIYIREDQAAMITSMKVAGVAVVGGLIGADLKAGDFFTFSDEITEIVLTGGSFIGYEI